MKQIQYVQRSRKKGAKLPPNTRVCTRGTKWGNPIHAEPERTAAQAVAEYKIWLGHSARLDISELAGYDYLSCFCAPDAPACHVRDVLIPAVNEYLKNKVTP